MARAPTPSTSKTSITAVVDYVVRPSTPQEILEEVFEDAKYGPYVFKYTKEKPHVKMVEDEPFMVRKLYKHFLDPYGFSRPIPRPPLPCWFCASADVRFNLDTLINNKPQRIVETCSCSCCPFSHIQCRPEIRCKAENDWHRRERIRHERLARKHGWNI